MVLTVQPAPFAKPHFVLTAAIAAVLLINRRSVRGTARSKNHASMIFRAVSSTAELSRKNFKKFLHFMKLYDKIPIVSEMTRV